MNVARANHPPTYATLSQNSLLTTGFAFAQIIPAIIMKQAAIGASYPMAKEESERVGLKEIIRDVQKAKFLSEDFAILFVKKYVAYAKKIDCKKLIT
jgi:hypothetical protein